MIVIGLTGSIGMGKSTVASILKKMGVPVYSADEAAHDVMKKDGKAFAKVATAFPQARIGDRICRRRLGKIVFEQPDKLRQLESIVHPLLRAAEKSFLKNARSNKAEIAVLEIPLLFETGAEKRCNIVLCVTAPRAVQKERVLARKNMTPEKLKAILTRQMPDTEKRAKADYVLKTGGTIADTRNDLRRIIESLTQSSKATD